VDILDQIDRALREVDEDGYLTDAMRWKPDASADKQDADLTGAYGRNPFDEWLASWEPYRSPQLDGEAADRLLAQLQAFPQLPQLPQAPLPVLEVYRRAAISVERARALQQLLGAPPPMSDDEVAALQDLGSLIAESIGRAVRAIWEAVSPTLQQLHDQLAAVRLPPDEPPADHPLARVHQLRDRRGHGPTERRRAPRRIDPRGTR
jgi:hypothetical protein